MVLHKWLPLTLTMVLLALFACAAGVLAEYDMNAPQNLTSEHLFAESALLVDQDSGEILFSKNARVRMYPASTTKIMTLLLALESDIPLDAQVTVPAEAADIPEGSSVIPVKPGDVLSFSDLLYGFMLSSGNDGANAIAVLVDGSIEAFVERMNGRAALLGCEGTHFVNAHGYHNSEHYTTAQDLALISIEAMGNADFRQIVAAPRWTLTIQRNGSTVNTEIISRNSLLQSGEKYYYPDCTGIKTGHHHKAGWCFVGSAQREGKRVICVVLNCEEEMSKWYDAARLFEYGFTRYAPAPVSELLERSREELTRVSIENADDDDPEGGALLMNLSVIEGVEQTVQVVSGSDAALRAATRRIVSLTTVDWERPLVAPVSEGERMGTLSVTLEDGARVTAELTASRAVAEKPVVTVPPDPQTPEPSVAEPTPDTPPAEERHSGNGAVALILALLGLLALACVAVALKARADQRRKARRRRRRKGGRTAPSRGTAPTGRDDRRSARRR